jgi:hypothetical protein
MERSRVIGTHSSHAMTRLRELMSFLFSADGDGQETGPIGASVERTGAETADTSA